MLKFRGTSTTSNAWVSIWDLARGKNEGKYERKNKEEIKKADLLDWLLAIDASMP